MLRVPLGRYVPVCLYVLRMLLHASSLGSESAPGSRRRGFFLLKNKSLQMSMNPSKLFAWEYEQRSCSPLSPRDPGYASSTCFPDMALQKGEPQRLFFEMTLPDVENHLKMLTGRLDLRVPQTGH
jgi:hypothetical protein